MPRPPHSELAPIPSSSYDLPGNLSDVIARQFPHYLQEHNLKNSNGQRVVELLSKVLLLSWQAIGSPALKRYELERLLKEALAKRTELLQTAQDQLQQLQANRKEVDSKLVHDLGFTPAELAAVSQELKSAAITYDLSQVQHFLEQFEVRSSTVAQVSLSIAYRELGLGEEEIAMMSADSPLYRALADSWNQARLIRGFILQRLFFITIHQRLLESRSDINKLKAKIPGLSDLINNPTQLLTSLTPLNIESKIAAMLPPVLSALHQTLQANPARKAELMQALVREVSGIAPAAELGILHHLVTVYLDQIFEQTRIAGSVRENPATAAGQVKYRAILDILPFDPFTAAAHFAFEVEAVPHAVRHGASHLWAQGVPLTDEKTLQTFVVPSVLDIVNAQQIIKLLPYTSELFEQKSRVSQALYAWKRHDSAQERLAEVPRFEFKLRELEQTLRRVPVVEDEQVRKIPSAKQEIMLLNRQLAQDPLSKLDKPIEQLSESELTMFHMVVEKGMIDQQLDQVLDRVNDLESNLADRALIDFQFKDRWSLETVAQEQEQLVELAKKYESQLATEEYFNQEYPDLKLRVTAFVQRRWMFKAANASKLIKSIATCLSDLVQSPTNKSYLWQIFHLEIKMRRHWLSRLKDALRLVQEKRQRINLLNRAIQNQDRSVPNPKGAMLEPNAIRSLLQIEAGKAAPEGRPEPILKQFSEDIKLLELFRHSKAFQDMRVNGLAGLLAEIDVIIADRAAKGRKHTQLSKIRSRLELVRWQGTTLILFEFLTTAVTVKDFVRASTARLLRVVRPVRLNILLKQQAEYEEMQKKSHILKQRNNLRNNINTLKHKIKWIETEYSDRDAILLKTMDSLRLALPQVDSQPDLE